MRVPLGPGSARGAGAKLPKAMPVILAEDDYATWLDGDAEAAAALAVPFPSQLMVVE